MWLLGVVPAAACTMQSGSKRPAEQPPPQQQQTKKQQQEAAAAQKEEKKDGKKDAKKEQQQKQKEQKKEDKKEAQPSPADNGKAGLVKTAEKNVRRWENGFEIQEVQLGECVCVQGAGPGRTEVGTVRCGRGRKCHHVCCGHLNLSIF